jgi:beta-lactamase superfamily II metal-dependent hydrolase
MRVKMDDFYEIDILDVDSDKSGDAICLRYKLNGATYIHVVDGGFQDTGNILVTHINEHYDDPIHINHVVLTHNDQDHAGGLRKILEEYEVGTLWMLKPWDYAHEIIHRFSRYASVESLQKKLREIYSNIDALEKIAIENGIEIREPFQGKKIGEFIVLSPSKKAYLDLIVDSPKTPDAKNIAENIQRAGLTTLPYPTPVPQTTLNSFMTSPLSTLGEIYSKTVEFIKSAWGDENLSQEETSPENEMSIVQYANLHGRKVLLTGDAGKAALRSSINYATTIGIQFPGINFFQVPHHGSRRNVSSEILDEILGPILKNKPLPGEEQFTAVVSSAKKDANHPRKSVIRAIIHRGGKLVKTEGKHLRHSHKAPPRTGWGPAEPAHYPDDQES